MTSYYNIEELKHLRRALRKQPIPSEILMWSVLRGRKFMNLKFRRQYGLGRYIIDFYCPSLHLAIEVDGESHTWPGAPERDRIRQEWIVKQGVTVVRFLSSEVINNIDGVLQRLEEVVKTVGSKNPPPHQYMEDGS